MAKLNETVLVIKVSELLRDDQTAQPVFSQETIEQIQIVLEELAGPGKLVELNDTAANKGITNDSALT
jgi:hypothetical protein|tara:strand:- start:2021 stop:2224 length:204 start_codon:yes stop_codon:yes gene_type:complete